MSAYDIILTHLPDVLEAFKATKGSESAYERLRTTCPALVESIPNFNTFKTVVAPMVATAERLNRVKQSELERVAQQVAQLREQVATSEQLHKVVQSELEQVKQELYKVTQDLVQAKEELTAVTQEKDNLALELQDNNKVVQTVVQPPKNFMGWTVQTDGSGYTRLHKKVGGKVLGIYIGREWNEDKARARIEAMAI